MSENPVFDYNQRDIKDYNIVENEAQKVFGARKEFDWALSIEEEEDAE